MATEPSPRRALIERELAAAPATGIRIVIDDLVELVLGRQPATRALVPGLGASRALGALPTQQLLRLRARLCTPLLPRLGRIRGRRHRTRPRVPPRLLLQPPQPILELLNPSGEIEDELHAHPPPGVVDRLGLGAVHTTKIRRPRARTLLWRPTTERLRAGIVPALNAALPPGTPAARPLGSLNFIAAGETLEIGALAPGEHRFECLIHPWMRLVAQQSS